MHRVYSFGVPDPKQMPDPAKLHTQHLIHRAPQNLRDETRLARVFFYLKWAAQTIGTA
ncbi:hypothetical protein SAMN05216466_108176 [Paraburkholderia phenazinium]|jgi:hypothetical protein|uniref:Uncharacterized protein n=1 Tax=Paraburkholderia phenazinium TaxID=60549 RepID=A0A1G8B0Y9_9BURK|nr:hypothetical protein SAMN05216466_108176 [Paraburkholderia phenazinium]